MTPTKGYEIFPSGETGVFLRQEFRIIVNADDYFIAGMELVVRNRLAAHS